MAQKKLANRHQVAEIVAMLAKGDIEFDLAQAIIEKKVGVTEKSRKLTPTNALEYSALVEYRQPSYDELKKAFEQIDRAYEYAEFKPIENCKDVLIDTREIGFELVHLDKSTTTHVVLDTLSRRGLRPALYEELLVFAAKFPDEQKKYPIAALGSVFEPHTHGRTLSAAYISCYGSIRRLSFQFICNGWSYRRFRFLAVRKPGRFFFHEDLS